MHRILYEVQNNTQWGNDVYGNEPPYNFEGFTQSTKSAYDLAIEFLRYYEKPLEYEQPERGNQATYWYNYLLENPPDPPTPPTPTPSTENIKKWLKITCKKIKIRY